MGLDIQSKEIIDKISDELKVQPSLQIPRELMDKIQLVYGVNPERPVTVVARATSSATLITTPIDRDFFLTGFNMSGISTASGEMRLTATLKGQAAIIIGTLELGNTVTVDISSGNITQNLAHPILLERGTVIALSSTGTQTLKQATIFGYTTDPQ